ncbi:MAG: hypothetical protein D6748_13910 [Calditrichaeota bacterium]|nr:MAG: hypothetical protein D6748_13910 [Calditrichota bacterium]
MLFRLMYEGAVGLITFIAVLLFGEPGFAAFALLALLPFIWRIKKINPDERELQLFYQTNNWALAFVIVALFILYKLSGVHIGEVTIGDYWFPLSVASVLIARGFIALLIFRLR